ncbi:MAG TPA: alpha/beta hydrolase [Actinobacteria bacterium]|nr:alpha/beta hydrolase [Actinomycetota bacterium]
MKLWRSKFALFLLGLILIASGCRQQKDTADTSKQLEPPPAMASKLPQGPRFRKIKIVTEDNIGLKGRIFGRGKVGIVLAHMYPADQSSWVSTAKKLSALNYRVLTFDFRGYGLSEGTKNIPQIDKDMLAAAKTLQKETEKIYVIGASMGGIAALNTALKLDVSGVVSLSAPSEFMGLKPENIKEITAPKLFLASAGDGKAAESARVFYEQAREPREIEILPGNKHGTNILRDQNSGAFELIANWLERHK